MFRNSLSATSGLPFQHLLEALTTAHFQQLDIRPNKLTWMTLFGFRIWLTKKSSDVKKCSDVKMFCWRQKKFWRQTLFLRQTIFWRQQFLWRQILCLRQNTFWRQRNKFADVKKLFDVNKSCTYGMNILKKARWS